MHFIWGKKKISRTRVMPYKHWNCKSCTSVTVSETINRLSEKGTKFQLLSLKLCSILYRKKKKSTCLCQVALFPGIPGSQVGGNVYQVWSFIISGQQEGWEIPDQRWRSLLTICKLEAKSIRKDTFFFFLNNVTFLVD